MTSVKRNVISEYLKINIRITDQEFKIGLSSDELNKLYYYIITIWNTYKYHYTQHLEFCSMLGYDQAVGSQCH